MPIGIDVNSHPAAVAWCTFAASSRAQPERIELIQERPRKATIYRLIGADLNGGNIIAKRCTSRTARTEWIVYDAILRQIAISAIQCYGAAPDSDESLCWLFLEDAAGERFSPECKEHRELAGCWLGLMHTGAQRIATAAACLPERSGPFYADLLQTATETTEDVLTRAELRSDCARLLGQVASRCRQLTRDWSSVERLFGGMPRTLVHGDLGDQNARVRNAADGKSLVVMDWEEAGWGVPAVDLAQFGGSTLEPDLTSYLSVARRSWTGITLEIVKQWAELGRLLRLIQAIVWTNSGFDLSPRRQWYFERMGWYETKLEAWIHTAGKMVT